MNLATLDVTRQQAAEAVIHYRRALKLHRNAEDEAILRGYNQVLKGRKLIQLSETIKAGGADEKYRPRLAVMGAAELSCFVAAGQDGSVQFCPKSSFHWRLRGRSISLPIDTLPQWRGGPWRVEARSVVPTIPPQHRPPDALSNYHILWEATWTEVPRDPALLRHLGGDLWAVLAVWDLTDLERAVLSGRRAN